MRPRVKVGLGWNSSEIRNIIIITMVDVQMQPLDLSLPTNRSISPELSPNSSSLDLRRLSSSSGGEESEEELRLREPDSQGPARKRFLSKFFRDPKGKQRKMSQLNVSPIFKTGSCLLTPSCHSLIVLGGQGCQDTGSWHQI